MQSLYFLQFIGAVLIILHHLAYPYEVGPLGSTFFIIISGFLNAYIRSRRGDFHNTKEYFAIVFAKIKKNYLLYLVTILIGACIQLGHYSYDWKDLVCHILMLQTTFPMGNKVFLFNVPVWFMATLSIIYFVLPLIDRFFDSKPGKKSKYLVLFFCFIILFLLTYFFKNNSPEHSLRWWFYYISPYSRIWEFIVGYVLYLIYKQHKDFVANKVFFGKKFIFTLLEIVSIYMCYQTRVDGEFSMAVCTSALILIFSLSQGFISQCFSYFMLQDLGKLSIDIFFWHQLVIEFITFKLATIPHYSAEAGLNYNLLRFLFILVFTICMANLWRELSAYFKKNFPQKQEVKINK